MRNSLQDQLLKAGLVTEKQVKTAKTEQRKEVRQNPQSKSQADAARQHAQRAAAEKAERDRQLNLQRQAEQEQKAMAAQVRQLVEANREAPGDGDFAFNFRDGNRVKRLYVSDEVRERLVRGSLAIVRVGKRYELVVPDVADKVRARDANSVVLQNTAASAAPAESVADPYAAYEVPDDLMW